jgi:Flp pilus assembly pilin Flp
MKAFKHTFAEPLKNAWAFIRQEEGQDLVEYTLLFALLICVCISGVNNIGALILHGLQNVCNAL